MAWKCNNCGHGAEDRPKLVCNCHCHEAWAAALEVAIKIAEHPYSIAEVEVWTQPTETGEAIAGEIRKLLGRGN